MSTAAKTDMDFSGAQRDLASTNVGGAPGVLVSGLVWLIAGVVWMRFGVVSAFAALFVGGMLIVPAALAIERMVFSAPKASLGNPLERLGLESTFVLFAGILIGYGLLQVAPQLAIPALAITIGARYFTFRTLYDEPLFWLLGALIATAAAFAALGLAYLPGNLALIVGVIEVGFAALLLTRWKAKVMNWGSAPH